MVRTSKTPVALVNMPFHATDRPSLGLSLLKSALALHGIKSTIYYLNLWFSARVGAERILPIQSFANEALALEWIFSEDLWGPDPERDARFIQDVLEGGLAEMRALQSIRLSADLRESLWWCRSQVTPFLEHCCEEVDWERHRVVGFTSSFEQQLACLSLAKRLKARYPHLTIVLGGANCRDEMGRAVLRCFPFVDAVCIGEGEIAFPTYVDRLLSGRPSPMVAGILERSGEDSISIDKAAPLPGMDELPDPDFSDFFRQRSRIPQHDAMDVMLIVESARGCWWAERRPCTFCGLSGAQACFRQKSARRAAAEMRRLIKKYGRLANEIQFTDNIMPRNYLKTLLPHWISAPLGLPVFYNIRPNLSKDEIRLCRGAGVTTVQPGIENLSSPILRLMGKGVTALQNIQLLKWCQEFGIHTVWNYLYGFPGEDAAFYDGQAALTQALWHLPPPGCTTRIRFDRYGTYRAEPERFGIRRFRASPGYRYAYPGFSEAALTEIASHFVCEYDGQEAITIYEREVRQATSEWRERYPESALICVPMDAKLFVCDFRGGNTQSITELQGLQRQLHEACDQIRSRRELLDWLETTAIRGDVEQELDRLLIPLIEKRLLLEESQRYLALGVPLSGSYFPPERVWPRLQSLLDAISSH